MKTGEIINLFAILGNRLNSNKTPNFWRERWRKGKTNAVT